jgi:hypothetical protein
MLAIISAEITDDQPCNEDFILRQRSPVCAPPIRNARLIKRP